MQVLHNGRKRPLLWILPALYPRRDEPEAAKPARWIASWCLPSLLLLAEPPLLLVWFLSFTLSPRPSSFAKQHHNSLCHFAPQLSLLDILDIHPSSSSPVLSERATSESRSEEKRFLSPVFGSGFPRTATAIRLHRSLSFNISTSYRRRSPHSFALSSISTYLLQLSHDIPNILDISHSS